MLYVHVQFHLNQYQGCQWGNSHIEGKVDWPPAPLRILRAIMAGAYNINLPEKYMPTLKTVLHKMSKTLPKYTLPPTTYIQHRSPRPQVNPKNGKVSLGKDLYSAGYLMSSDNNEMYIHWDVDLTDTEEIVVNWALSGLMYFGRREASATLQLVETAPEPNAYPEESGTAIVTIADPKLDSDSLWDSLKLSPAENFQEKKRAVFPGIMQASYTVEPIVFSTQCTFAKTQHHVTLGVKSNPPIPVQKSVTLIDRVHRALVRSHPHPVFTGKQNYHLNLDHNHTMFQFVPDRSGRYIDRIELYSYEGYDSEALSAIVSTTERSYFIKDYKVSLTFEDYSDQLSSSSSMKWKSISPFFLTRHPAVRRGKPRMITEHYQKDGPEHQALQYLLYLPWLGLTGTPSFQELDGELTLCLNGEVVAAVNRCTLFPQFYRWELDTRQCKSAGYGITLEFCSLHKSPISLGHACHYGLGEFVPV